MYMHVHIHTPDLKHKTIKLLRKKWGKISRPRTKQRTLDIKFMIHKRKKLINWALSKCKIFTSQRPR